MAQNTRRYQCLFLVFLLQPSLSNRFTSSFHFLNCATEMNFPLFHLFNAVTSADMCVYPHVPPCIVNHEFARDIAWRVRYLRTKDAHKQLAPTSLTSTKPICSSNFKTNLNQEKSNTDLVNDGIFNRLTSPD